MNFLFSFVTLTVNDIIYTTVYFVNLHRGMYHELNNNKSWNLERI